MTSGKFRRRSLLRRWAGKPSIQMTVIAIVVGKSGLGQKPTWRDETVNRPFWRFVPSDIERQKFREELQLAVGKIVVNPPRHRLPGDALGHPIDQPRHDNCRQRTHVTILITTIPRMAGAVLFVRCAAEPVIKPSSGARVRVANAFATARHRIR